MNVCENWDDNTLIDELNMGNQMAFKAIYFRYSGLLYRYAFNILRDEEECSDVIQEVFVWLWENRTNLNILNLKNYLLAVVKYKLIRVISSGKRKKEILAKSLPVNETDTTNDLELKELKQAITDFTAILPVRARETFQLSREQFLTNKEIALEMGISEKTVEAQMTISLRKLKLYLNRKF
ncbi:sigma-70 family RNA polymerase sigma factor [Sphingobacterium spiritivorum]|uniref:sigma-70 family RNA polymerase sigma factor n=1 Tax=Sphingobacterium spiritivorum TaxID=258 RepID=UPI00191A471C|nr:sigma-70 family RNA polymerase sigma factor [Sphingobacterium spiritivorum]QQT25527.1 sigma-70 family RNA polymerase sigma factor [Sphingobacterium spiritivorum]